MSTPTTASLEAIEEVFSIYDTDRDGKIAKESIPNIFRALGKAPTQAEVKVLLEKVKDFIDLAEFKNLYRANAAMKTPKKLEEDMLNCFRATDREGSGQVHEAELRQTLSTLGDVLTPNEVDQILQAVTINSNGMIDYDKFVTVLIEAFPPDM